MIYYSLFLSLFFLYARGLFEVLFSKRVSYFEEFSFFLLFFLLFLRKVRVKFSLKFIDVSLLSLFLVFVITSALFSFIKEQRSCYLGYLIYFFYMGLLHILFSGLRYENLDYQRFSRTLKLLIFTLTIVAFLEEADIFHMPGESRYLLFIRPSSLTGSYLHYPLVLVSLGLFLFSLERRANLFIFLSFLGVFLSFSRSGMLIVILTMALWSSRFFLTRKKIILLLSLVGGIFLSFLILYVLAEHIKVISAMISRVSSIISFKDPGNIGRLRAWRLGLSLWMRTNLFIGEYFGEVTNFTKNMLGIRSIVVESSILQLLLNVGLVGTVFFYILWIRVVFGTGNVFFRLFFLSVMIETFVYQSVEVLPFVTSLFLFYSFVRSF